MKEKAFNLGRYGVQIGRINYPEYSFHYISKDVRYYVKKPRENFHLSLFPGNLRASFVKMLRPKILDNGYRWRYDVESSVTALWIQIHLLKRILELPMWDRIDTIPLHFQSVSTEQEIIQNAIRGINLGRRMPAIPPPTKYPLEEICQFILHQNPYSLNWNLPNRISRRQYVNWIRHRLTPYDYLWQTGVVEYEEAKEGCNNLVKKTYPELF